MKVCLKAHALLSCEAACMYHQKADEVQELKVSNKDQRRQLSEINQKVCLTFDR